MLHAICLWALVTISGLPSPVDAGPVDAADFAPELPADASARDTVAPRDVAPDVALDVAHPATDLPSRAPPARVRFRGTVLAKGTRETLGGASISVDAVPVAEADADGRFDIEVPPGHRRLQIQHPGFVPLDQTVTAATNDEPRDFTFRLMPRLTGEKYETVVTPVDEQGNRTSLREEELTRTPGSLGDPFRVIESLPGVSQVVWPLAMYAIRGANPGNTGFFLDGVRVPALFHYALGPSVIHPFFLQQVDFYPGGYPVRFGRYVSGIVSAQTATPATDRPHASTDVRLFDAGGIVASPWDGGRGSVAVAGRFSYTGFLLSQLSADYKLSYWDYQVRADHVLGSGRATVFAFGAGDTFEDRTTGQGESAALGFHRLSLRWSGAVLGGRLDASALVGRDATATSLKLIAPLPIGVTTLIASPRLAYARPLAGWLDAEIGVDAEFQRFRPQSQTLQASQQDAFHDRAALSSGGYAGVTMRGQSGLSVAPGLRYDVFHEQGVTRAEPEPRVVVRVPVRSATVLKGSFGRFAQMASLPVGVPGFEGFGLSTYGTQTSLQGSLGIEAQLGEALSLDTAAFYQRLKLTDLKSMFNLDPQQDLLELRDGQSYGGELMLRRPAHHRTFGWATYTLSWSQRLIGHYHERAPSDWDQRHIFNFVLGRRFGGGYSAGLRFHLNSGRNYPVFDERAARVDYQRLPAFYQLDWRVDKRMVFDRYVLDVYLELVNSTLTREVVDLKRDIGGNVREKGFRVVLPSIGIHAEW